ncbi:MAG: hypothetical protein CMN32_02200 [Saprospirales bacterium]|nr:hypothetical protein [Saprospirales bacterium]
MNSGKRPEHDREESFLDRVEEKLHIPELEDVRTGKRVPHWLRRIIFAVLLVIFLPVLAFQIPWVQSKAAKHLAAYLSKELNTTVSVQKVWLGIFTSVNLEDLYIEDQLGDTLIYTHKLDVSHQGLHTLLSRKLRINSLQLTGAEVNLSRPEGSENFNIQFLLDYLARSQDKAHQEAPKPFTIDLKHLYLDNVRFRKPDAEMGKFLDVAVSRAEVHFRQFDLNRKNLGISRLSIWRPYLSIITTGEEEPVTEVATDSQTELVAEKVVESLPFVSSIGKFELREGEFSLHNYRMEPIPLTPDSLLNFRHLDLSDINIDIEDFTSSDLNFHGRVNKIAANSSSGFVLESLSAQQASVTCDGMELYGLKIKTPDTDLGDTLIFRYDGYTDWQDFVNEVKMEGRFHNSSVTIADIIEFAPALNNNPFFRENSGEVVRIKGIIKGAVNSLDARDLVIDIADGVHLEGRFNTRNLAVKDEQFVHMNLKSLKTDMQTIRKLIPGFNPPENFYRLGRINFSGKFDGFFVDFVADGKLRSNIGTAEMFMNLKLREGREKAEYSGDLYLNDFDLGKWSGNSDFGKVTLNAHVKEGVGLTLNAVNAKVNGVIDSLEFKNYLYKKVALNGHLEKDLFDGELEVHDPNVDLTFAGTVNFASELPVFNFRADLGHLAPNNLNLSQKDLRFHGKVDLNLKGNNLSNIVGEANIADLLVVKNHRDSLRVNNGFIRSAELPGGAKEFVVNSSLGDASVVGRFNIDNIPTLFLQFFETYHPRISEKLGIAAKNPLEADSSSFEYSIELKDLQHLTAFIDDRIDGFDETAIKGHYDGVEQEMFIEIDIPKWSYANATFSDLYLNMKLTEDEGNFSIGVFETELGNGQKLAPVRLIGYFLGDTVEMSLIATNFYKIMDDVSIDAVLTLDTDDAWHVQFLPGRVVILNQPWDIDENNFLRIGEGSVQTKNFVLTSGKQRIVLENVKNKGLQLQLNNYPIQELEFIRKIPRHKLKGIADLHLKAKNIFQLEGLAALLRIDSLNVNGDDYGTLRLDASAPNPKQSIIATLAILHPDMNLRVDGYYNPPNFDPNFKRKWVKPEKNYLDVNVSVENYPLHILEYFVEAISEVKGTVTAEDVHFTGPPNRMVMAGEAEVKGASFRLIPLQTVYSVPSATVALTETTIDGTGHYVYDSDKNRVYVEGGLTHDHLRHLGVDLKLTTENGRPFLAMNTTEKDNPVFYGTAYGTGYVTIKGDLKQPELLAVGRSMPRTKIVIPLSGSVAPNEVGFITFPKQDEEEEPELTDVLRGLNMTFDLELTPDANIELIFDKAYGDVIKGNGNGNIQVIMKREGTMEIYGDYTVSSGEYLFTLMNLGFNKAFTIEPGGTITWSGDPYNANIDIDAVYDGTNTSVYNFIQEYLQLASSDLESRARTATPVRLKMKLKGELFRPDISFDVEFPSLDTELRSLAENKLRIIRQDPNELNRQVFGLLVLGQFLPSDYTLQAQDVTINTLSEMLSNQLSIYVTEFLSELLAGNNIIQGIDLDLSYNRYGSGSFEGQNLATSNEVQGKVKVNLLSDRFSIKARGNFEVGPGDNIYITNNGLVAHEFVIEYAITKDRRLKIRAYQSSEPDIGGGQRTKYGGGLSFRKEFDNLSELFNFIKKKREKK